MLKNIYANVLMVKSKKGLFFKEGIILTTLVNFHFCRNIFQDEALFDSLDLSNRKDDLCRKFLAH